MADEKMGDGGLSKLGDGDSPVGNDNLNDNSGDDSDDDSLGVDSDDDSLGGDDVKKTPSSDDADSLTSMSVAESPQPQPRNNILDNLESLEITLIKYLFEIKADTVSIDDIKHFFSTTEIEKHKIGRAHV